MLAVMKAEDSEMAFVFPLIRQRKIVEYKDVDYHYTRKLIIEPIYKYIYETVEVIAPVKEGSVTVLKKVKRRKLVKRLKTGEREIERLVYDPKGDIIKTHRRPVYGPGGPDIQPTGWAGNNAMALYALLEAGVAPDDVPELETMANSLRTYLRVYGIPDYTYDIAWSIAAFSCFPGNRFDTTIQQLCSRLMAGQSTAAKSRGMWGPLSVNSDHVVAVLKQFLEVEHLTKRVAEFAKSKNLKKDDPQLVQQNQKLQQLRERIAYMFETVSRNAHRSEHVTKPFVIDDDFDQLGTGLQAAGWPYNFYHETLVDLQSTALAVFALRVAKENDKLPKAIVFKHLTTTKDKPLVKPIQVNGALGQTLSTLAARSASAWNEMIVWEKNSGFARLDPRFKGPALDVPRPFRSQATPICSAQGAAAMEDLTIILGDNYKKRYSDKITTARQYAATQIAGMITRDAPAKKISRSSFEYYRSLNADTVGLLDPFDFLHQLRLDPSEFKDDSKLAEAYQQVAEYLIEHQTKDGLWTTSNVGYHHGTMTPSLRQWTHHRIGELMKDEKVTEKKANAFKIRALSRIAPNRNWYMSSAEMKRRATVFAILALSRGTDAASQVTEAK